MLAGLQWLFSVGIFSPECGPTIKVSQPDVHWLVFLTVGVFSPECGPAAKGGLPVSQTFTGCVSHSGRRGSSLSDMLHCMSSGLAGKVD